MNKMPPCLLWDVDGTLTDTTALIAAALEHVYVNFYKRTLPYEERCALIGTPLKKQIRVFGEPHAFGTTEEAVMDAFIAYYEEHKAEEKIFEDVLEVLKDGKRRGIPTGLVTSKNREELDNTMPRLGIADFVDFTVTADDIPHPKPAPDGILLSLRHFDIPADQVAAAFYIGDTLHDMRAARDAGVQGVGVTWGAAGRSRMEIEAPPHICQTAAELRTLLLGS